MKTKIFWGRLCSRLPRLYINAMTAALLCIALAVPAMAATEAAGENAAGISASQTEEESRENNAGTSTGTSTSEALIGSGSRDMWSVAQNLIVDVYNHIAGISTALAGLMSAVAIIGVKLSNNQHKSDQAWDWLKRIWIAWAIINGIGAFIAYIAPQFSGLGTLTP